MISVTYLDHSGFAVTTPSAVLVFDYYKDPDKRLEHVLNDKAHVPVIFFVTDHRDGKFDTSIHNLAQNRERYYVLPSDIEAKTVPDSNFQVQYMAPGDEVEQIKGVKLVRAFHSSGPGVSYEVVLPTGEVIYHAGDMGVVHATPNREERKHMERFERLERKNENKFTTLLGQIAEAMPEVKIAFFPVDASLGAAFAADASAFLEKVKVDNFFPIHIWGEPQLACDFDSYFPANVATKGYCLTEPGKTVEIK